MLKRIVSFDKNKIYFDLKEGEDNTIVFIHGLGTNHTVWNNESKFLHKKGYRIISIDLRGHGYSAKPTRIKITDFDRDIFEVLKDLKIKDAILVGHSMGGLIAIDFAARFADKVKALILIDSTYELSKRTLIPFFRIGFIIASIIEFIAKNMPNRPRHVNFQKLKNKSDLKILYELDSALDVDLGIDFFKELLRFHKKRILKNIKVPTLIIASKYDEIFRISVSRELHEKIKNSTLITLKGTHSVIIKNPKLVSHEILKFLKSNVK